MALPLFWLSHSPGILKNIQPQISFYLRLAGYSRFRWVPTWHYADVPNQSVHCIENVVIDFIAKPFSETDVNDLP